MAGGGLRAGIGGGTLGGGMLGGGRLGGGMPGETQDSSSQEESKLAQSPFISLEGTLAKSGGGGGMEGGGKLKLSSLESPEIEVLKLSSN